MYSGLVLINLDNGDIKEVNLYKLGETGIPEGYKPVEEISQIEWANMYSKLSKEAGAVKRTLGTIMDELMKIVEEALYEGTSYRIAGGFESVVFCNVDYFADGFKIDKDLWEKSIVPAIAKKYDVNEEYFNGILENEILIGNLIMKTANTVIYLLRR
jgi:hypothetical protein